MPARSEQEAAIEVLTGTMTSTDAGHEHELLSNGMTTRVKGHIHTWRATDERTSKSAGHVHATS